MQAFNNPVVNHRFLYLLFLYVLVILVLLLYNSKCFPIDIKLALFVLFSSSTSVQLSAFLQRIFFLIRFP